MNQRAALCCAQTVPDLEASVYCLTVNLTSDEWIKISNAAAKQWPIETLSAAEIVRRYIMFGIQSLKNTSKNTSSDEQARATHQLQSSMEAQDKRLKH
jgi:hypothetical protein